MEMKNECPVCFGEENIRKLNGCGHEICVQCEVKIKEQPYQVKSFHTTISIKQFIKCPLCREHEKPTYAELEDRIKFLEQFGNRPQPLPQPQQIVSLRRNPDGTYYEYIPEPEPVVILPPSPQFRRHDEFNPNVNHGMRIWCVNHNKRNENGELICTTTQRTQRRCMGRNCVQARTGRYLRNAVPCCQRCNYCPDCR